MGDAATIESALVDELLATEASDPAAAARHDPLVERATLATQREDWANAQGLWKDVLSRNPADAEYHNMYAYSLRKGPNPDMSLVFNHYNEALRLDPKHRGANEYLGRVASVDSFVSSGLVPLSLALTGPVSAALGTLTTLRWAGVIAGGILLAFLALLSVATALQPRPDPGRA